MTCPLCLSTKSKIHDLDKARSYLRCCDCSLIYVQKNQFITQDQEKQRYDAHENNSSDPRYRSYLVKISESIRPYLKTGDQGLDFGSGKSTLLAELLMPFETKFFDIYYHPDHEVLDFQYDFIILSEVIEHLRDLRTTMLYLRERLKPTGKLFIKTKFYPTKDEDFKTWFYKRDLTHVAFFDQSSFYKLGEILNLEKFQEIGEDLYLFKV